MKRSRSLPFTVSLVPAFLFAVLLVFLGLVELLNMLLHALGAKEYRDPRSLMAGVVAALVLWCCFTAFKMQRGGIYGLCVASLFLVVVGLFTQGHILLVSAMTVLPVIAAFAFKDFEKME